MAMRASPESALSPSVGPDHASDRGQFLGLGVPFCEGELVEARVVATAVGPDRFPVRAADEIYYSGDQFNRVTVREGQARRLLNPRCDMGRGPGLDEAGPKNGKLSDGLSYALLADALENDARALRLRHAFGRRVGSILPDRWTLSRSRIRAYADMIERYREVGIDAGADREAG